MNLKVAMIGCGNIAKVHMRFASGYVQKKNIALCDNDTLRLEEFSKTYSVERKYTNLDIMLDDFKPDIVHILTPPASHKDIALKCLKKGSHVLIEKPAVVSLDEMDQLIASARENKRMVCVDHMRVFDPFVLKARQILDSGAMGEIVNISANYSYDFLKRVNFDPASRWINNLPGGVFFDLVPHPLCVIENFLPGLKFEKSVSVLNNEGMITDIWSVFSTDKATASLHMSLNIYPLVNFITIECTKGILTIDWRNFLFIVRKQYSLPNAVERIVGNFSVGMQIIKGTLGSIYNFIRGRVDPYAGLNEILSYLYTNVESSTDNSPVPAETARKLLILATQMFEESEQQKKQLTAKQVMLEPADVLVTGGTGFIGRRLVNNLLSNGKKVRIFSHRIISADEKRKLFQGNVEIVRGDIYNLSDVEKACLGVSTVYHLAAAMKGNWNYHLDTTITGSKNMLKAAEKSKVKRFVYVSTLNVYDAKRFPANSIINEDFKYEDMPERRGAYSHAKLRAEKIVCEYEKISEMSIVIIRPGLVYGPGGRVFPQDIGYRVGKKLVIVLGNGTRKIPFVYVDNLVDGLINAGEKAAKGIFNVVDPDYPNQRQFIKLYKKETGESFFVVYIPLFFILAAFWFLETMVKLVFKKNIYLRYKINCVSRNVKHSTSRIEDFLGWKPRVLFSEGVRLMLQVSSSK